MRGVPPLMCGLTALYLIMGGYRAVALTDVIQGAVMIFGVGMLLYYIIGSPQAGGIVEGVRKLAAVNPGLAAPVGPPGWLPLASLVVLTSLGPWGLPQMVQKFYAVKNEKAITPAMVVATLFALVITFGAYFPGSLTRLFFEKLPVDPVTGKATPDLLMPILINNNLPETGAAVILLLVLSASMSTLASLVLVSSSAIAIDLLKTVRPDLDDKRGTLAMRLFCLVFIALSLALALIQPQIILSLMAMSWGTVAGFFLAPYLYGLFWRGATPASAWAGAATGLVFSVAASLYFRLDPGLMPTIGSLAMIIPLAVMPLVALFTRPLPADAVERAFGDAPAAIGAKIKLEAAGRYSS